MGKLFTSESVTEGHPDKIADQISDAILDALIEQDPDSRVAAETTVATGLALVVGEITTKAYVDIAKVVRNTIRDIGYTGNKAAVRIREGKVAELIPLDAYTYSGFPLVNGRGFAILVDSKEKYQAFMEDFKKSGENPDAQVFDKWMKFETSRTIVFHDNFWII